MNNKVYFYKTVSKKEIIVDFIDRLDAISKVKVRNGLRLLEEYGLDLLRTKWIKKIYKSPAIYELRIVSKKQIRLLFIEVEKNIFLVVNIFVKKSQKLPKREFKMAIKRVGEFI
ncbi:type II toxin-antitoxin system RelE/ParE family toxin [Patescibacteria group bacterium]|nr:type II toxin-antitoxin system RelE/ParE family toxin [Patescibacteria group bacterium]